jgi:hypothetical protein
MKVNIGKYVDYWTVYTFADKLHYLGISEDKSMRVGELLSKSTILDKIINWRNDLVKRKVEVKIEKFDVWSMDNTLAIIIVPMLELLKKQKHGSAQVDIEDVPPEYKQADVHERWDWTLDEMIWAFTAIRDDEGYEYEADGKRERVLNALRLFGKYYFALWD